jgi:hypothetical protein
MASKKTLGRRSWQGKKQPRETCNMTWRFRALRVQCKAVPVHHDIASGGTAQSWRLHWAEVNGRHRPRALVVVLNLLWGTEKSAITDLRQMCSSCAMRTMHHGGHWHSESSFPRRFSMVHPLCVANDVGKLLEGKPRPSMLQFPVGLRASSATALALSEAWIVLSRTVTRVVGSNPSRLFCISVVLLALPVPEDSGGKTSGCCIPTAHLTRSFSPGAFPPKTTRLWSPTHPASLERQLKGRHFDEIEVIKAESQAVLNTLTDHGIQELTEALGNGTGACKGTSSRALVVSGSRLSSWQGYNLVHHRENPLDSNSMSVLSSVHIRKQIATGSLN